MKKNKSIIHLFFHSITILCLVASFELKAEDDHTTGAGLSRSYDLPLAINPDPKPTELIENIHNHSLGTIQLRDKTYEPSDVSYTYQFYEERMGKTIRIEDLEAFWQGVRMRPRHWFMSETQLISAISTNSDLDFVKSVFSEGEESFVFNKRGSGEPMETTSIMGLFESIHPSAKRASKIFWCMKSLSPKK
jgi:hypothetical protein